MVPEQPEQVWPLMDAMRALRNARESSSYYSSVAAGRPPAAGAGGLAQEDGFDDGRFRDGYQPSSTAGEQGGARYGGLFRDGYGDEPGRGDHTAAAAEAMAAERRIEDSLRAQTQQYQQPPAQQQLQPQQPMQQQYQPPQNHLPSGFGGGAMHGGSDQMPHPAPAPAPTPAGEDLAFRAHIAEQVKQAMPHATDADIEEAFQALRAERRPAAQPRPS